MYPFSWYLQHFRPLIVNLHGICNVLDFGSILLRGICAMFWSLDSLFDWYLQRIGAGAGISELMLQKRATE